MVTSALSRARADLRRSRRSRPSAARGSPREWPALFLRWSGPRRQRPPARQIVGGFDLKTSQFRAQSRLQWPLLAWL